jgi:hypothetical protein
VEKDFFKANGSHIHAEVTILTSDKADFRLKSVRLDNEGLFILIKGTAPQEVISILNICASNIGHATTLKKISMDLK